MRTLIILASLIVVGFALFRSMRPGKVISDSSEITVPQPAAAESDDALPLGMKPRKLDTIPDTRYAESLDEIHKKNDESFRLAPGNGRSLGGAHVLMRSGPVVFVTDTITAGENERENLKPTGSGVKTPYGLWGALGTPDHSFQKLSRQPLKQQGIDDGEIELIQLVSVNQMWAYDDDELPSMKQLHDASIGTRPLNTFETESVTKLQQGEDLVIKRSDDSIAMLGAIHAESKCLLCHSNKETDLLGACSYRIKLKKE